MPLVLLCKLLYQGFKFIKLFVGDEGIKQSELEAHMTVAYGLSDYNSVLVNQLASNLFVHFVCVLRSRITKNN